MTRRFDSRPRTAGTVLAAATVAILSSLPAMAQGTDAQREACAPDAIKLCSDTIPDVATTTACMRRHYSQLSKRCRVAFDEAAPQEGETQHDRVGASKSAPPPADETDHQVARQERTPGLRSYEAHIRDICRKGLVDAFTCRNTLDLLQAGE